MPRLSLPLLCTASALLPAFASAQATMTPLPTFGTAGWLAPGSTPYLTTGNTERGLSYNPTTGNVLLVARQNVAGISNNVRILDGATGADLFGLDNTGVAGGTFLLNMVDVAADGSIYAANLTISSTANFKVYKWAAEAPALPPTVAYDNLTGLARTGDSFAVTGGSGPNPVIFAAAGSNNVSASNFVVGTVDATNTSTTYLSVPGTTTTSNDYRLSLTFVDQDTLIGNQGATARVTSFDPISATLDASIPLGGAARRPLDYAVINGRPVIAVIDSNSSLVTVFDITDPNNPVALVSGNNTTGVLAGNTNGSGSVAWGAITGSTATLYAMSSNQGIQAFEVTLPPAGATAFGSGCDGLGLVANGVPAVGNLGFELAVTGVSPISPIAFVAFGTMGFDPGIPLAGVGMPGCNGHQNLDIGLFTTGPVVGGTGLFPLPIPLTPSLVPSTVTAQGVCFTLATPAGLASSNGVTLVVGF